MNKVFDILEEAGIGKLSIIWAFIKGGWDDLGEIVRKFISHFLSKADAAKLKIYGERFAKTMSLINYAVDLFVITGTIATCLRSTATAFGVLGEHCADGNYTKDELDADVNNIGVSIAAWNEAGAKGVVKQAIMIVLGAIAAAAALVAILVFGNGCAYKGGKIIDGTNLAIGMTIPGTEWSINVLDYVGGMRVAGNDQTSIVVSNEVNETNSYFGVVETQRHTKMTAKIEPTIEPPTAEVDE